MPAATTATRPFALPLAAQLVLGCRSRGEDALAHADRCYARGLITDREHTAVTALLLAEAGLL